MSFFSVTGSSSVDRPSWLPALVGVMMCVVFWMAADHAREQLPRVELQTDTAAKAARRANDPSEAQRLETRLDAARAERSALAAGLRTNENAQMVRARMVFDLRQKCEAAGATGCTVRLADDTIAARPSAGTLGTAKPAANGAGGRPEDKTTLIDLGVQKARAIITGSFQKDELVDLNNKLNTDLAAHWRINGVVVRGPSFELDVERHIITPARETP